MKHIIILASSTLALSPVAPLAAPITCPKDAAEMNVSAASNESAIAARRADNLKIVHAYFRLQAEKNLDAWFDLWSPGGVFVIPYAPKGFPERIEGRSALEPLYRELFEGYGELRYHDLEIHPMADPDMFVATWVTDVDLKSGGIYVNKLVAIFRLRDSKVIRYDEYFDPTRFGERLSK